jgi:2-octaprenylphenol hydroxylase
LANSQQVLIVGAGMVGLSVAVPLLEKGLAVTLVDPQPVERDWPPSERDIRVSALTRASQCFLEHCGAWPRLRQLGCWPYRQMRVWDAGGDASLHFAASDVGQADLGHLAENRSIRLALYERLADFPQARLLQQKTPRLRRLPEGGVQAGFDDGGCMRADLLVIADGRDSSARHMLGFEVKRIDYNQSAVVANVRVSRGHRQTAWQRFLPTGPLAFLPLDQDICSIVWSTLPERAEELLAMDAAAFQAALQQASEGRLGDIQLLGRRASFALRAQQAGSYAQDGVVLVGDAAHALHPLAGQGVNLGFMDAQALTKLVRGALEKGRPIGGQALMGRYQRERRFEDFAMVAAMDGFKRVFMSQAAPVQLGRNLLMKICQDSPFIRSRLIERAMGLSYCN